MKKKRRKTSVKKKLAKNYIHFGTVGPKPKNMKWLWKSA